MYIRLRKPRKMVFGSMSLNAVAASDIERTDESPLGWDSERAKGSGK